jgi:hypothetical protein
MSRRLAAHAWALLLASASVQAMRIQPDFPVQTTTIAAGSVNGWTPKPTSSPSMRLVGNIFDNDYLRKRDAGDNLCGYIDGDAGE